MYYKVGKKIHVGSDPFNLDTQVRQFEDKADKKHCFNKY